MEIQFIIANKDSWNLSFSLDTHDFRKKKKNHGQKQKENQSNGFVLSCCVNRTHPADILHLKTLKFDFLFLLGMLNVFKN